MKNAAKPNLAHVERGQAVLVWLPHDKKLVSAKVQAFKHGEVRVRWIDRPAWATMQVIHGFGLKADPPEVVVRRVTRTFTVRRRDEGTTWVFDRDDATAHAFKAACVMA